MTFIALKNAMTFMVFGAAKTILRVTEIYARNGGTGGAEEAAAPSKFQQGHIAFFCISKRFGRIIGLFLLFKHRLLWALH